MSTPYGTFYGGSRGYSYTYYGDGGQQVVFELWSGVRLPERMEAEELIVIKERAKTWNYYPLGKLF